MSVDIDSGDWIEYKRLVIEGINSLKKDNTEFRVHVSGQLTKMSKEIVELQVKVKSSARNWLLLAGVVCSLIVQAFWMLAGAGQ